MNERGGFQSRSPTSRVWACWAYIDIFHLGCALLFQLQAYTYKNSRVHAIAALPEMIFSLDWIACWQNSGPPCTKKIPETALILPSSSLYRGNVIWPTRLHLTSGYIPGWRAVRFCYMHAPLAGINSTGWGLQTFDNQWWMISIALILPFGSQKKERKKSFWEEKSWLGEIIG